MPTSKLLALCLSASAILAEGCAIESILQPSDATRLAAADDSIDDDGVVCKAVCDRIKEGMTFFEVRDMIGRQPDCSRGSDVVGWHSEVWFGKNATLEVEFSNSKYNEWDLRGRPTKVISAKFYDKNMALIWWPSIPAAQWPGCVSKANFDRVELGMSEKQVNALMGRKPDSGLHVTLRSMAGWSDKECSVNADFSSFVALGHISFTDYSGKTPVTYETHEDRQFSDTLKDCAFVMSSAMEQLQLGNTNTRTHCQGANQANLYRCELGMTKSNLEMLLGGPATLVVDTDEGHFHGGCNNCHSSAYCWIATDGILIVRLDYDNAYVTSVCYWNRKATDAKAIRPKLLGTQVDLSREWSLIKLGMHQEEVETVLGKASLCILERDGNETKRKECWFDPYRSYSITYGKRCEAVRLTVGDGSRVFRSVSEQKTATFDQ